VARVTVRVGDYKIDSSTSRGDGTSSFAALDDDPLALRAALWQASDEAYKMALAAYAQKQAQLKQVQTPPQQDDSLRKRRSLTRNAGTLKLDSTAGSSVWRSGLPKPADSSEPTQRSRRRQGCAVCHGQFHARAVNSYL